MKRKRVVLGFVVLAVCLVAGCGSEFAAGAAAGAAGTVTAVTTLYEQQQAEYQAKYEAAVIKLATAATEAEKMAAESEAMNASNKLVKVQGKLATVNALQSGQIFTDQSAVIGILSALGVGWATRWLKINGTKTGA